MSILSWLGRQIGLTDGRFWAQYENGESFTGKCVNAESALTVAAFWACVRLLSQTIGTLPLGLYERQDDGGRLVKPDHPLYSVLHDMPNADQTAVEFWEGVAASLGIWGNAYGEKVVGRNKIMGIKPMPTTLTTVFRDKDGSLKYRFNDRGKTEVFPEDKIFHVKGFGLGGDMGLSPIGFARQALGAAMAADEASARMFSNGLRPSGFFTVEKVLTKEQRVQAKEVLIDPYQGVANSGKVGILEAGFKWQDVQMSGEDAQMLQTRGFNVEEVCRWLGVPPILIGHASAGQTMWGSGVEQIMLGWLTLGLRPYLTRIEQAIKRSLLTVEERKTLYAEFTVEGLLRADSAARASLYSVFAQNGIMTRNEMRAKENLPAMDGGDELTCQSNLVLLADLGNAAVPTQQQARAFGGPQPIPAGGMKQ